MTGKIKIILLLIVILGFILRTFHLSNIPPSLYWDEASLGYNAYSISQSLHDEHGQFLPLARFIAFGDYKAPGYIYADSVVVKVLGLSEFSVRFPSALAGTLLVLMTFFLLRELALIGQWGRKIDINSACLVASLFVAISPWTIQFSRGGFEANLATMFELFGIYFLLLSIRKNSSFLMLLSSLATGLSFYSFNSHRVFLPLFLGVLFLIFLNRFRQSWKLFLIFGITLAIMLTPLIPHMISREGKLRFYEVTWLNDLDPITLSVKRKSADNNSVIGKVIHNKYVVYSGEFLTHYFDHLDPGFLFFRGDVNPRLSTQSVGEMYLIDLIYLLSGIFFLIKFKNKATAIIFAWIILAPIPAALAHETPHALRVFNVVPMPQVIAALGILYISQLIRRRKYSIPLIILVSFVSCISIFSYLQNYYYIYPKEYATQWQYGYKQMVQFVRSVEHNYDHISVTTDYGRPYIYFLFYNQYSSAQFLKSRNASGDAFGLWTVYSFDKYTFGHDEGNSGKWLYVRSPSDPPRSSHLMKTIFDPLNKPIFEIWSQN